MRTRILAGEDLQRLTTMPGPFDGRPDVVAQLGTSKVVAVETNEGQIVAYWPIWVAVHLEPLWIDPRGRHMPVVAKLLVEGMRQQLAEEGITTAFAIIGHEDLPTHLPMATRLGFRRMPGDLFFLAEVTADIPAEASDGGSSGPGNQSGRPVLPEPGREQADQHGAGHRDQGPPGYGD